MADYGGLIVFRLPSGGNMTIRGSVTRSPARFSYEAINNHDGSNDRSVKPEGYTFGLSLADRGQDGLPVDFEALMAQDNVSFTFMHATERVDRVFSRAKLIGRPEVDAMTGEVTGITGIAEGYLEVPR